MQAYFAYNAEHEDSRHVHYIDYPKDHVWKIQAKAWAPRQRGAASVGRMYFVPPTSGERFFLRLLLTVVPGAQSFEHLRTVDVVVHPTFQSACGALGLLQEDTEWDLCLREACFHQNAPRLRNLFATLLLYVPPFARRYVYDMTHDTRQRRDQEEGTREDAINDALLLLDERLALSNKSLRDFPEMPIPVQPAGVILRNAQLRAERAYDRLALQDQVDRDMPQYILRVGNGEGPPVRGNNAVVSFGDASPSAGVEIALYAGITRCETLVALINKVYPSLPLHFAEQGYVDGRAILTTKNAEVNQLNDMIAALIPGEEQFPLQLAFAMTINKAQGQKMDTVGIHLPEPVFTHGQLYVVLSRASRVSDVALHCPNGESTTNVVYKKMLQ
ncbi:hypothetical protein PsorP6_000562 [Peronosclerospora sorghi]|uniref:Uncharacterized protein n=1 Tax=Peronosclerospora sorghi TaxID=230839 RepID=A0ACC0WU35_9STRA|nr:hypothetical protein PsorP6_000562 [Peronosclerospora sorghi]